MVEMVYCLLDCVIQVFKTHFSQLQLLFFFLGKNITDKQNIQMNVHCTAYNIQMIKKTFQKYYTMNNQGCGVRKL